MGISRRTRLPLKCRHRRHRLGASQTLRGTMSIAEIVDLPLTHAPLVPPRPPRAPENMSAIGRIRAVRANAIQAWGQRAYEEDIIQSRLAGRRNFVLNEPNAIRHVLVDNYENY